MRKGPRIIILSPIVVLMMTHSVYGLTTHPKLEKVTRFKKENVKGIYFQIRMSIPLSFLSGFYLFKVYLFFEAVSSSTSKRSLEK